MAKKMIIVTIKTQFLAESGVKESFLLLILAKLSFILGKKI